MLAHLNEYDFDSPSSIDFDILVERLSDLKAGYVKSLLELFLAYPERGVEQKFQSTRSRATNVKKTRHQYIPLTC